MNEKVLKSLLKKAKGYTYKEVQEEYEVDEDGAVNLRKKKVTTKYSPPDTAAAKTYIELSANKGVQDYSDEELEIERQRLLKVLKEDDEKK